MFLCVFFFFGKQNIRNAENVHKFNIFLNVKLVGHYNRTHTENCFVQTDIEICAVHLIAEESFWFRFSALNAYFFNIFIVVKSSAVDMVLI